MTPRRFKCSQFGTGTLNFNFECIRLLQNDFCKQRYISLNATISGQDRIYPKTHLCRTFFEYRTILKTMLQFCCDFLLPVFGVRVWVTFHLTCLNIILVRFGLLSGHLAFVFF